MSTYQLTVFVDSKTSVRGHGMPNPVLCVEPNGPHRGGVTFQMPNCCTAEERAKIAEEFLKGVTAWRDEVVGQVEAERTALDELAEARAEIDRLKAAVGGVS